ncbi:MAG: PHP domain-containing protein [Christensenellaceae bacterium]|nr:PHP domain-containing protein [Christensenellaceae bacterium]
MKNEKLEIKTDLHTHTTASTHAYSTILENVKVAAEKGMELIAMTNHGSALADGAHFVHFLNLRTIPEKICGVKVLKGIEANVLNIDGELDLFDDFMPELDIVIASCHVDLAGGENSKVFMPHCDEDFVKLYENLAKDDRIDIIGHINRTKFINKMDYIIPLLRDSNKLIEINTCCHSERQKAELIKLIDMCYKHNAKIVVNSDAHYCSLIGDYRGYDEYLTKIGYPPELVINRNAQTILQWLHEHHKK